MYLCVYACTYWSINCYIIIKKSSEIDVYYQDHCSTYGLLNPCKDMLMMMMTTTTTTMMIALGPARSPAEKRCVSVSLGKKEQTSDLVL